MENEAKQLITCRFCEFLVQEKTLVLGLVQKYYFFGGSCRNITVPSYCIFAILCRASFRVVQKYWFWGEIFTSSVITRQQI